MQWFKLLIYFSPIDHDRYNDISSPAIENFKFTFRSIEMNIRNCGSVSSKITISTAHSISILNLTAAPR